MNEEETEKYWEKYIEGRRMYRVFPKEFMQDVKENGLNPKNNPYKEKYSNIKKLFKILSWIEKKHDFGHTQFWGKPKNSDQIIKTTLYDMKKQYIDFTPHLVEVKYYKKLMKKTGSALVSTIKLITQDIISRNPKLPQKKNYK